MPLDPNQQITLALPNGAFKAWDEDRGEAEGRGPIREVYARDWLTTYADWNILCAWSDRVAIATGLLGYGEIVGGVPRYNIPAKYPDVPSWFAKYVECRGVGLLTVGPNGMSVPQYARMHVRFGPGEWDPASANMIGELELDFAVTPVPLPQSSVSFTWTSDSSDMAAGAIPAYQQRTILATLTLYNRGTLNQALIGNMLMSVNSGTFEGFAAEQVLFHGARSRRTLTVGGQLNYSLQLNFEILPRSWNTSWRGIDIGNTVAGFKAFTIKGTGGQKLYPTADFTALLA